VHRSQFEPKLLDMLTDPVTQAVMDADRVDLRELIADAERNWART
jgi:hypothetical protein